jgi:hypothetical protein
MSGRVQHPCVQPKHATYNIFSKQPVKVKNLHLSFFSISKEDVIRSLPTIVAGAKYVAIALAHLLFFGAILTLYINTLQPWCWELLRMWLSEHFLPFSCFSILSSMASYYSINALWDRVVTPWAAAQAKRVS